MRIQIIAAIIALSASLSGCAATVVAIPVVSFVHVLDSNLNRRWDTPPPQRCRTFDVRYLERNKAWCTQWEKAHAI